MRRIHNSQLVFIHIPKNAGMSVLDAFSLEHRASDHWLNSPIDTPLMTEEFIRFCVFRNPYERFISAYCYSVNMLSNAEGNSVRMAIRDHGLEADINKFVAFFVNHPDTLLDNLHFHPQILYLQNGRPHIILRQESLASDINLVKPYAEKYFTGLKVINRSSPESAETNINTSLSSASKQFIAELYLMDFVATGYDI